MCLYTQGLLISYMSRYLTRLSSVLFEVPAAESREPDMKEQVDPGQKQRTPDDGKCCDNVVARSADVDWKSGSADHWGRSMSLKSLHV